MSKYKHIRKSKLRVVYFDDDMRMMEFLYRQHITHSGLWFQWWHKSGKKSFERFLKDYYDKYSDSVQ